MEGRGKPNLRFSFRMLADLACSMSFMFFGVAPHRKQLQEAVPVIFDTTFISTIVDTNVYITGMAVPVNKIKSLL